MRCQWSANGVPAGHLKEENDMRSAMETAITAVRLLLLVVLLPLNRGHHDKLWVEGGGWGFSGGIGNQKHLATHLPAIKGLYCA